MVCSRGDSEEKGDDMDVGPSGIHHVTAIASNPRANAEFYLNALGMRLVKRTVNFDSPDVYHLYYAASVFGGDRSCIGHASKPALDSSDAWTDLGSVICSNTGSTADDWNAIDPELLLLDGVPWLVFGSYQSGIKLIRLDPSGSRTDSELYSVAERTGDTSAVQQPVLWQRAGYFYLFSSFDTCCRGVDSTHKIMVGRAADITGPYLDRAGARLLDGGGTLNVG